MTAALAELDLAASISVFAALGDRTRIGIITSLGNSGPSTAAKLAVGMPISRQAVGKQLAILAEAGIVSGQRIGREHVWGLNPAALEAAGHRLSAASVAWDAALERLRAFVEG